MKPVKYHRFAESELVESSAFYERRREFLGDNFLDLLEETLEKIQSNSDMGLTRFDGHLEERMRYNQSANEQRE